MSISFQKSIVCPMLIGRAFEMETLETLLRRAIDGHGGTVLTSGEAGVGKSRLVAHACTYALASGPREPILRPVVLHGHCFENDAVFPYAPLRDMLRTYLLHRTHDQIRHVVGSAASACVTIVPELAAVLPEDAPKSAATPEEEKRHAFAALSHIVTRLAADQPVLMAIEDIHWSDEVSLDFLLSLARQINEQRVLLLLTYRDDEVPLHLRHVLAELDRSRCGTELPLSRLTVGSVDAMVRAIFGQRQPIRTEFLQAIYDLTDGNPFFVEEVLTALLANGDVFYASGTWERRSIGQLQIPRSIQDAVSRRSERLTPATRVVLSLAAVVGRRFDFTLMQRLTGYSETEMLRVLKELIAAQLIVEESDERFAFRHALTRQAVYSELLERERRIRHAEIVAVLEQHADDSPDTYLVELAEHSYRAGMWEKALVYTQRAGARALAFFAPRAGIEQLTRAHEAARHLSLAPSPGLLRARGLAYETVGDFDHALGDLDAALHAARAAGDRHAEWQALLDLGLLWSGRDYTRMGAYAEEAVAQARTMLDPVTLAHSLNRVANWHVQIEQPLESLRYHQQALPLFEETGHRRGMAETLDFLGIANYFSGDLWQGTHCYTRAIALFRELDERPLLTSCLTNLLWGTPTYLTDTMVPSTMPFDEITRAAQEACTLSREIGRRSSESFAQLMLAIALGTRGEYRKALTLARSSLEIATEIEHRQWTAASHCALGVIFHDLLAPDRAQWHLEQFHDIATTMHSVHEMRCAAAFLASVHVTQRAFGQAAALLDANLDANTQTHTLVQRLLWTARAECVLAQGDARTALGIVDRLLASATNLASQQTIPRVAMVRGRALVALKQFDDAEIVLSAAQRTARDHEALPLLWRILGDQGRLYLATGRRVQAADAFAAARSIVGRLADQLDDDTLRAQFLDRTVTRIPRGRPLSALRAARQGYGGLTAREREVAVLVAQGHANRVIAELLVVSERTVEVHVSNALSKLGFASRVQIAAWVVEHGLLKNYVASPQKS